MTEIAQNFKYKHKKTLKTYIDIQIIKKTILTFF